VQVLLLSFAVSAADLKWNCTVEPMVTIAHSEIDTPAITENKYAVSNRRTWLGGVVASVLDS